MQKFKQLWQKMPKAIRKPTVFVVGGIVVLAGIAMLALPGPGWAAIFLGFAILATEFALAKTVQEWLVAKLKTIIAWCQKFIPRKWRTDAKSKH